MTEVNLYVFVLKMNRHQFVKFTHAVRMYERKIFLQLTTDVQLSAFPSLWSMAQVRSAFSSHGKSALELNKFHTIA